MGTSGGGGGRSEGHDRSGVLQEIERLFRQHNPDKLGEIDGLVGKFGEQKLLLMMRKKAADDAAAGQPPLPHGPGPSQMGAPPGMPPHHFQPQGAMPRMGMPPGMPPNHFQQMGAHPPGMPPRWHPPGMPPGGHPPGMPPGWR